MLNPVTEAYTPKALAATGAVFSGPGGLIGFLCTTAGTLQVSDGSGGTSIIEVFDVAEGGWYPMPFTFVNGAYATLGGGAQGTFGYSQ